MGIIPVPRRKPEHVEIAQGALIAVQSASALASERSIDLSFRIGPQSNWDLGIGARLCTLFRGPLLKPRRLGFSDHHARIWQRAVW